MVRDSVDADILPEVPPNSPAFILFTSGSTGKPKGIVIEHQGFCYGAHHHGSAFDIGPETRVFQFAAHIFDISFSDMATTLLRGGCVCIPSEHDRVNDLAGAITKARATYAFLTPTVANTLSPQDTPSLRTLVIGGEAPTQAVIKRWADYVNLIVVWGPAECTVYSTAKTHTRADQSPSIIGTPIGARVWITEPDNPDCLAPVGAAGELLVEGPIVARGYLNEPEKTAQAFVVNPSWTQLQTGDGGIRRFYRTADMGRYAADGALQFVGRRDNQVKVRGQRVELPEIEHQARGHQAVEHCSVFYQQHGPFKDHLTAIITLSRERNTARLTDSFEVLPYEQVKSVITSLKEHLESRVPPYMVPATFIGVESFPLMPSGKLNRPKAKEWLVTMDDDLGGRLRAASGESEIEPPRGEVEEKLLLVWSRCLGTDPNVIGRNSSFLSLGGDSISAMQVVSRCAVVGLGLAVQDILQSRTIASLATRVKIISSKLPMVDSSEMERYPFHLSPMQRMYFQAARDLGPSRFNQSFSLALQTHISPYQLQAALQSLCKTHSMLRARFFWDAEKQAWLQRISEVNEGSCKLKSHSGLSPSDLVWVAEDTQKAINIQDGPLLSVSLSSMGKGADYPQQVLFLTCHHLVVDLVSWRIILDDLESLLKSPGYQLPPQSTSFAAWRGLQQEYDRFPTPPQESLSSSYSYWGLDDGFPRYRDHVLFEFNLDHEAATEAVRGHCNQAFNTEPVELMLAALVYSFSAVFNDRGTPVIFNESHGRHSSRADIDLSRTVGWFTTIFPVAISFPNGPCLIEGIRRVKDSLRAVPEKTKLSVGPMPMEILFNYGGRYQQLNRSDSLFRSYQLPGVDLDAVSVDSRMQRFALIEVSVLDLGDRMNFGFRVDHRLSRMQQVEEWVSVCEETLSNLSRMMGTHSQPQPTLTDYPLLQTYDDLDFVIGQGFQVAKIDDFSAVEDVYPCTPLQEQMLNANQHDSRLYIVRSIWELTASDGLPFDAARFEAAWVEVVRRHDVLRTRFVPGPESGYYQVVLRDTPTNVHIERVECLQSTTTLLHRPALHLDPSKCPYRWDIAIAINGHVSALLQISHAIIDGLSIATLYHELSSFYRGTASLPNPIPFKSFVRHLQLRPAVEESQYWIEYLGSAKPCYVRSPSLLPQDMAARKNFRVQGVDVIRPSQIKAICARHGITASVVFQTAYALALGRLCSSDSVCFGYVSATRDLGSTATARIDPSQDAIGPFINFLACRENVAGGRSHHEIMQSLQASFFNNQKHQHVSLDQIYQAISAGTRLFNTVVNYQGSTMHEKTEGEDTTPSLRFNQVFAEDPMEVSDPLT